VKYGALLLRQATPKMINSTVVDNDTGKSIASTVRTSTGTFFAPHEDEVIQRIEERIAVASHFPEENGEGIQVICC
jgi:prolyl 4-hydroxylase